MSRESFIVQNMEKSAGLESFNELIGSGKGRKAFRSAPLSIGKPAYWYAAARILKKGPHISEAVLVLRSRGNEPRRLSFIEKALIRGELIDADEVLDAVRDFVKCDDDEDGSAAAKSFLAGWLCADVISRCLDNSGVEKC
jgi:hypothetical protein